MCMFLKTSEEQTAIIMYTSHNYTLYGIMYQASFVVCFYNLMAEISH